MRVRSSMPLSYFRKTGAILKNINASFVLVTRGDMTLTLFDVAVMRAPRGDSILSC